jgi:hypothetical protein
MPSQKSNVEELAAEILPAEVNDAIENSVVSISDFELEVVPLKPSEYEIYRSTAIDRIVRLIIFVFATSLALALIILLFLVYVALTSTNDTISKVIPVFGTFLEIVKTIGVIFSPLLAFILGYYFSLSSKQENSANK